MMQAAAQRQVNNESLNGNFSFNVATNELTLKFADFSLKQVGAASIIVKFIKSEGQTLKLTATDESESGAKYSCAIRSEPNSSDGHLQSAMRLKRQLCEDFDRVANWEAVCPYLLDDKDGQKTKSIRKSGGDTDEKRSLMIEQFLKKMVSADIADEKAIYSTVLDALRDGKYSNLAEELKAKYNF